jgi:hypothetical protein
MVGEFKHLRVYSRELPIGKSGTFMLSTAIVLSQLNQQQCGCDGQAQQTWYQAQGSDDFQVWSNLTSALGNDGETNVAVFLDSPYKFYRLSYDGITSTPDTRLAIETAAMRVRWAAVSNVTYQVKWSRDSHTWSNLSSVVGSDAETNVLDWSYAPPRRYRLQVLP